MCCLQNIAMSDYQESVTTEQTDAGESDPNVLLCFAGDTITANVILPTAELLIDHGSSRIESKIFAWFNEGSIIPL